MKIRRRIIAVMLSAALAAGNIISLPVTSFAEEIEVTQVTQQEESEADIDGCEEDAEADTAGIEAQPESETDIEPSGDNKPEPIEVSEEESAQTDDIEIEEEESQPVDVTAEEETEEESFTETALCGDEGSGYSGVILDAYADASSDTCTVFGLECSFVTEAAAVINRINEIRYEACTRGDVPDPRNSSRYLTESDYVPMQWSSDLEYLARIRAAEESLAYCFSTSGHARMNGLGVFTLSSNGVRAYAENAAFNYGTSMVYALEQWYSEMSDWINQTSAVTGHYTSMINPSHVYVGLGTIISSRTSYKNVTVGLFSYSTASTSSDTLPAYTDSIQKVQVLNSYIDSYYLESDSSDGTKLYIGNTEALTPRVELVYGSKTRNMLVMDDVTFESSDDRVASVSPAGLVTGLAKGDVTITAYLNGSALAQYDISVSCEHSYELTEDVASTCTVKGYKKYICTKCGESYSDELLLAAHNYEAAKTEASTCTVKGYSTYKCTECGDSRTEELPLADHNYIYGEVNDEGYATGICSECSAELRIKPCTSFTAYWANNPTYYSPYYSYMPSSNAVGSVIGLMVDGMNGEDGYNDIVVVSADESIVKPRKSSTTDSLYIDCNKAGITTLTTYAKYNPSCRRTFTVRVGDTGSVDISPAEVTFTGSTLTYTGSALKPSVTVSYNGIKLSSSTDYSVSYEDNINAGQALLIITGAGIFAGTIEKEFTISPKDLSGNYAKLSAAKYEQDGTAKEPAVTVSKYTYSSTTVLTEGTDFSVSYTDNIAAGTASAVISGIGNYCGSITKTFTIVHTKHSYGASYVSKAATCTENGEQRQDCAFCDAYLTEEIAMLPHTSVTDERVEPTCTNTGLTEGSHCSACGEILTAQQVIPAIGHSYSEPVFEWSDDFTSAKVTFVCSENDDVQELTCNITSEREEPGCTSDGTITYTAKAQFEGNVYTDTKTETLKALGHDYSAENTDDKHLKSAADCLNDAVYYVSCVRCGKNSEGTFTLQDSKLGHSFVNYVHDTKIICTEGGTETAKCERCDTTDTREVPAKSHTAAEAVKENVKSATCTEEGSYELVTYCSDCGTEMSREAKTENAAGHKNTVLINTKEATCTESGYTGDTYCNDCENIIANGETTPPLGHTAAKDVKNENILSVTCTTNGSHYEIVCCEVCGEEISRTTVIDIAPGHTVVIDKGVNAGCTTTGLTPGSHCSVCGEVITAQKTIPAAGHTAVTDAAAAATCLTEGKTAGSHCETCGDVISAQRTIPAAGHTAVTDAAKAATYQETGFTEGSHCSVCGAVIKAQENTAVKALGKTTVTLSNAVKGVKISWKKVTGATGYKIYRGTKLIKTITSGSTVSFTDTTAKNGAKYTYYVVAYAGSTSTNKSTSAEVTTCRLTGISVKTAKNTASKQVTVTYGKNSKASGYQIRYVTGSKTKTVTVIKAATVKKVLTKLTKGRTYKIYVRAYKKVSDKTYYSAWSSAKSVKVTK